MTRRVKRIAPLQAGKMLGIIHALLSLLYRSLGWSRSSSPGRRLRAVFPSRGSAECICSIRHSNAAAAGTIAAGMMIGMAIVFPIFYGVFGFIFGIIGAAIYNLIARWVGGLEFETEDVSDTITTMAPL